MDEITQAQYFAALKDLELSEKNYGLALSLRMLTSEQLKDMHKKLQQQRRYVDELSRRISNKL